MELDRSTHPQAPKSCPACQSVDLTTSSHVIDAATYWRCERCGEVWNVIRRSKGTDNYRQTWRRSPR